MYLYTSFLMFYLLTYQCSGKSVFPMEMEEPMQRAAGYSHVDVLLYWSADLNGKQYYLLVSLDSKNQPILLDITKQDIDSKVKTSMRPVVPSNTTIHGPEHVTITLIRDSARFLLCINRETLQVYTLSFEVWRETPAECQYGEDYYSADLLSESKMIQRNVSRRTKYTSESSQTSETSSSLFPKKDVSYQSIERFNYCIEDKTKTTDDKDLKEKNDDKYKSLDNNDEEESKRTKKGVSDNNRVCLAVNPDIPGLLRGVRLSRKNGDLTEGRCLGMFEKNNKRQIDTGRDYLAFPVNCKETPLPVFQHHKRNKLEVTLRGHDTTQNYTLCRVNPNSDMTSWRPTQQADEDNMNCLFTRNVKNGIYQFCLQSSPHLCLAAEKHGYRLVEASRIDTREETKETKADEEEERTEKDQDIGDKETDTGDKETDTGDKEKNTGDKETDTGDKEKNTGDKETDTGDIEKNTGDNLPENDRTHFRMISQHHYPEESWWEKSWKIYSKKMEDERVILYEIRNGKEYYLCQKKVSQGERKKKGAPLEWRDSMGNRTSSRCTFKAIQQDPIFKTCADPTPSDIRTRCKARYKLCTRAKKSKCITVLGKDKEMAFVLKSDRDRDDQLFRKTSGRRKGRATGFVLKKGCKVCKKNQKEERKQQKGQKSKNSGSKRSKPRQTEQKNGRNGRKVPKNRHEPKIRELEAV